MWETQQEKEWSMMKIVLVKAKGGGGGKKEAE